MIFLIPDLRSDPEWFDLLIDIPFLLYSLQEKDSQLNTLQEELKQLQTKQDAAVSLASTRYFLIVECFTHYININDTYSAGPTGKHYC